MPWQLHGQCKTKQDLQGGTLSIQIFQSLDSKKNIFEDISGYLPASDIQGRSAASDFPAQLKAKNRII
jgi:hypothetical protein